MAICSWSGGKDSCLALYKAKQAGYSPKFLLTMCVENGTRSRSHGLSLQILRAQADALGIPLATANCSWQNYSARFADMLVQIKTNSSSKSVIFGDLDLAEHKKWSEEICSQNNLTAFLPLWNMDRKKLLHEFFALNFQAMIVAVDAKKLSPNYLGRILDIGLSEEFAALGIDICGEQGEYHTAVFSGPLFKHDLSLKRNGTPVLHSDYWFQDFELQ